MKRLLLTIALFTVVSTVGVWAQHHWTLSHDGEGASTETVVYAKLDLGSPSQTPDYANYEVAAFVGDEVRAVAACTSNLSTGNNNYFLLNVKGNYDQAGTEDDGKNIAFKMYNLTTGVEYNLTPASAVTFNGGSYGSYSALFALSAVEVEMMRIEDITMNKGDVIDLTTRLAFEPANATMPNGIKWGLGAGADQYVSITEAGVLTALAPGENIEVTYQYGIGSAKSVYVTVKSPATAITVNPGYETIYVNVGDEATLTSKLRSAVTLTPADATDVVHWVSADEAIVYENLTNGNWVPAARGTVTMTAQIWDDKGIPRLTTKLDVRVVEPLTGFTFSVPDPLSAGTTQQIVVNLEPETADVDVSQLAFNVSGTNLPEGWKLINVASVSSDGNGHITYTVDVVNPGTGNFVVSYEGVVSKAQPLNAGVPLLLDEGWQWKTLWTDIPTGNMQAAFTTDLVEIRSQNALMANDAQYGYFGTLYDNGLMSNTAYKVHMSKDVLLNRAYVMQGGNYLARALTQNLQKGWTWITYPYYHAFELSVFNFQATAGDRIVSLTDGFAEFDGTNWVGTLTELLPWTAYLYYNNKGESSSFDWADEPSFYTAHPRMAPRHAAASKQESVWRYDARKFRDNMSIIARLSNVSTDNHLSVGAFVGDECRGEGRVIDGKLFITVHADQGELVTFKLYNRLSGQYSDIAEQVKTSAMLGTLAAPFELTAKGETTGIRQISADADNSLQTRYDLIGRRVGQNASGIVLQRMADGTIRKVFQK